MKRLNICLVSLTIAPDRERSGFEGIFEYLKKQGHNVRLITGKWNIQLKDSNIIQIDFIRKRFLWGAQFNLKVAKFIRKNRHSFDIFHGNGSKGTLPIILSNQKKFISTIHDLGPFETKFTKIPLEKYLIKYVSKKATYLSTPSNFTKMGLIRYIPKIEINKICTLYNGIDKKFKPYPKEAEKLKKNLGITGPIIIYIGRIANYKGVEFIIAAYKIAKKYIPNLNMVIVGNPDYNMARIYEEWKSKYKEIHFLGFVPEEQVPILYSMSDVLIAYSSSSEGFGNTPIEAIACGTPTICSSLKVYKEILQNNSLYVPPKRPQLLANEILRLLKDDDFKNTLIEKAQKFIKRYTWDAVGIKLEKVYERFLNN